MTDTTQHPPWKKKCGHSRDWRNGDCYGIKNYAIREPVQYPDCTGLVDDPAAIAATMKVLEAAKNRKHRGDYLPPQQFGTRAYPLHTEADHVVGCSLCTALADLAALEGSE